MGLERVFCCKCGKLVDAKVERLMDMWQWECVNCNAICDQEFVEGNFDPDDLMYDEGIFPNPFNGGE